MIVLLTEMLGGFARQDVVARGQPRLKLREMEDRIAFRLGCIVAISVAVIIALQHIWPAH